MNIKKYNPDSFILGLPVPTEIGDCHFLSIVEFNEYSRYLSVLAQDKNRIMALLSDKDIQIENKEETLKVLSKMSLFELVNQLGTHIESYTILFGHLFRDEDAWNRVNEENFDELRALILAMSSIPEDETSSNPEIQRRLDKDREVKSRAGSNIETTDMITSINVATGISYSEIAKQTYFQVQSTFKRIAKFKAYDFTTLMATVAEKVELENWAEHIPLINEDEQAISRDKFNNDYGNMFNK